MDNLKRHHLKAHGQPFVKNAASTSSSESGRMPHPEKENAAPTTSFVCPVCDKNCSTIHGLIRHLKIHASYGKDDAAPSTSNENNMEVRKIPLLKSSAVIQSAFKSRIKTLRLENSDNFLEIKQFLNSKEQDFQDIILNELQKNELKVNCMLMCKYSKASNTGIVTEEKNFKTKNNIILTQTNIGEFYYSIVDKLLAETADFQEKESGWFLHSILYLEIRVNKFNPLHASSFIELPDIIKKKHAVINIQNDDNLCFKWAVLSALFPVKEHTYRTQQYNIFSNSLDFTGINFPTPLKDIQIFEEKNNISINVYGLNEKNKVFPLLITKIEKKKHLDLMYVKNSNNNSHYCWIKSLSRLVSSQLSNFHHKTYICRRCLQHFISENILTKHRENCNSHNSVRIEMPKEKFLFFKNFQHSVQIPFVAYADFECITKPISSCEPSSVNSFTMKYQKHEPYSFCFYICYMNGMYKYPIVYRGSDAAKVFMEVATKEAEEIEYLYSNKKPMIPLTKEQQDANASSTRCYICGGNFTKEDWKVRDHCHLTGVYRGPAHNSCNLKFKVPNFLPIIFHNLSGYDSHLFIKELGNDNYDINVIPENTEKYISFSKKISKRFSIRFLDSCRFMPSSLEKLAINLKSDQFRNVRSFISDDKVSLLMRKGCFPYDYVSDVEKLNDTCLPPKEKFYNRLNDEDITDDDYQHANHVWNAFNIKSLGDYSDLYVKTDVLLLSDIFENFRSVCMKAYNLDPVWYYTAPGLSWDSMLKLTNVKIELLMDYDMYLFVEKGIRGGISQCSNRYAMANNKFLPNFEPSKPQNFLLYLDANNLYGWAMSQPLPLNNFKWVDFLEVDHIDENGGKGYILEVDLEYPESLHDYHSDLPLAPESSVPPGCKEKRLLTTLYPKTKYVVHIRNLKQYLKLGLVLKKVHKILEFHQESWLQPYIKMNTQFRTEAENEFEKNFYKLMNNAIFGKTMENIRKRVDIRLCSNGEKAERLISKPNFKDRTIFCENLAAFHMSRTSLTLNKPIALGMSIFLRL
ncbi:uncharacterized protein NPIL_654761 [Nephila pilipes]|uniref:C2H2-type domain-containing protein n=1 Tax=Nephila pilipes TaxID=299642 RepID=A0A8X6MT27_NEPPI|nr:uncharacterized protein NPIL_654761 [Nephila pilipes]